MSPKYYVIQMLRVLDTILFCELEFPQIHEREKCKFMNLINVLIVELFLSFLNKGHHGRVLIVFKLSFGWLLMIAF